MKNTTLRDLPPFSIRLQPELRAALEREAGINGRTLSAEIIRRLKASLDEPPMSAVEAMNRGESAFEVAVGGVVHRVQPRNDAHRMLLALFDAMGPDKQLALLTVLKR